MKALRNKKILVVLGLLAIIGLVVGGMVVYKQVRQRLLEKNFITSTDVLLLKKSSSWGPCPPQAGACYEDLEVYTSGKLVEKASKTYKTLPESTVQGIKDFIQSSGIMTKDCPASIILDYSATYVFYQDGKERTIEFPGCEADLKSLDSLLPK